MENKEEREIWKNVNPGLVYIDLDDPYTPNTRREYRIEPGATVAVSPQERRFNQSRVARQEQDLFTNGTLQPVQLIDSAMDFEEIASSPNVKTEPELRALFELKATEFKKSISDITNVRVLEQLAVMAEDETLGASLTQSKAIQARITELKPSLEEERNLGDQTGNDLKPRRLQ